MFVGAVEVDGAGEDVGAGQSHERQLCPVGAAAYGLHPWRYAGSEHGALGTLDDVHVGRELLEHVVVLVGHDALACALAVLGVYLVGNALYEGLALFELFAVVVADDVAEACLAA